MTNPPGIFCLEGSWAENGTDLTDRLSVEQQLRMFEGARVCNLIHRDVATQEEFKNYLNEWLKKRYDPYSLAYLAFHGDIGTLMIGETELSFAELTDMIGPKKAHGRILYFGSCLTMAATEHELRTFCVKTGARAIVGYTRKVDWLESAAFDCLLVPKLLRAKAIKPVYTGLLRDHQKFVRRMGLRMATSNWATVGTFAKAAAVAPPEMGRRPVANPKRHA